MKRFETSIQVDDLMLQSQKKGAYAKERHLAHLPQYGLFTLKRHPRLYGGTGTVALFRYLGLERNCNCLDVLWGSGLSRGNAVHEDCPYTSEEKAIGASVQIVSWLILAGGYGLVLMGLWNGLRFVGACREDRFFNGMVCLCPIFCLVLLALVIGPITSTRYRFIMISFFAMIAARARQSAKPLRLRTG